MPPFIRVAAARVSQWEEGGSPTGRAGAGPVGGGPGRGEWEPALQGLSETWRAELAGVSEQRSLRRSRRGDLQVRERGASSLGRRVRSGGDSRPEWWEVCSEKGTGREASATASLLDLRGHTRDARARTPRPLLLPQGACRYREGPAQIHTGEGRLLAVALLG